MYKQLSTGLLALVGISSSGFATLINASFEEPAIASGTYASVTIPGWHAGSGSQGVFHLPYAGLWSGSAPDGVQVGYAYNAFFAQQSTDVIGIGTHTISAYGGRRGDGFSSSFTMEMWAGGTESAGSVTGGTLLTSVDYNAAAQALGSFTRVSAEYEAAAGNPYLGQLITVRFVNGGGAHTTMDDVRISFSAAVPEPASLWVLGLGIGALIQHRRRGIERDQL